ncbi:MAG: FAD-dependent oxidoreductase [Actinomycetota bacterium]|nr:FAD-dependent oxidoreductase [Actinomycetota bacterium]
MKAIVVGAGTAGLAALHALDRAGVEVSALERESAAGGRIAGAWRNGYALDLGAQFFFRESPAAAELARDLGLEGELRGYLFKAANYKRGRFYTGVIDSDPRVLWRHRRLLMNSQGFTPAGLAQMARFMPAFLKRRRDYDLLAPEKTLDLDGESAADFALRRGGEEVLEGLVQPVVTNLTLGEPEEVAAGYALTLLWNILHGVFTFRRGLGTLASRLADEHRGRLRTGTPARRIVVEGGRVRGVETDEGFMDADAVVCATTATTALELMPDLPASLRGPLERVRYSACCHVIFALRRRLFPDGWYGVGFPRREGSFMNLCDNAVKSPYYAPEGCSLIHCFTYGRHSHELLALEDGEVLKRVTEEIRRYFPDMTEAPLFAEVRRWREAVCLSPPGMLGAVAGLRGKVAAEVKGLHLAGEYMYMPSAEAALRSGLDAAGAVLANG